MICIVSTVSWNIMKFSRIPAVFTGSYETKHFCSEDNLLNIIFLFLSVFLVFKSYFKDKMYTWLLTCTLILKMVKIFKITLLTFKGL